MIIGPTGIGKSQLALHQATQTGACIMSTDAFQVYQQFSIGTGKVSQRDRQRILHYGIDTHAPTEPYSLGAFLKQAATVVDQHKAVIFCGGSPLYSYAWLNRYTLHEPSDPDALAWYTEQAHQHGSPHLWRLLQARNPDQAQGIHPNNTHRIIRALCQTPGTAKTACRPETRPMRVIGLYAPREVMRARIAKRVMAMLEAGWIAEVAALCQQYPPTAPAFRAIGYDLIRQHLQAELNYTTLVHRLIIKTQQFAKRQLTWYRKFNGVEWFAI